MCMRQHVNFFLFFLHISSKVARYRVGHRLQIIAVHLFSLHYCMPTVPPSEIGIWAFHQEPTSSRYYRLPRSKNWFPGCHAVRSFLEEHACMYISMQCNLFTTIYHRFMSNYIPLTLKQNSVSDLALTDTCRQLVALAAVQ